MPENSENKLHKIAILLGANGGNEESFLDFAAEKLRAAGMKNIRRSTVYRTAPINCVPGTPDFFNQALTGEWEKSAVQLLSLTQSIELAAGRPVDHASNEARVLDCDIILFDESVVDLPQLQIPHPRAKSRAFVLIPLAEIAGNWRFPDGESVAEAAEKVTFPTGN